MARRMRSVCSFLSELEPAVHARYDKIEARQNLVGIIQRSVRKDVGLDALQDAKCFAIMFIQIVNLGMLLNDFVHR